MIKYEYDPCIPMYCYLIQNISSIIKLNIIIILLD